MTPLVSFVSSHAELGGSERVLNELLDLLPDRIASVACLREGPFVDRLRDQGVSVSVISTGPGPISILKSAVALRRHLADVRPEVIHANGVKAAVVCVLARPRRPIVWWKHDFSWDGRLARTIAKRCALVVGVSEAVLETLPPSVERVVVHPGVHIDQIDRRDARARLVSELELDAGASIVTLVGRMHPVKGHRELLSVIPELAAAGVHVTFVGPSDPDHASYARAIASEADRHPNLHVLGGRDDVLDVIAASDAVAIPSVTDDRGMGREGFGLVAVEAMALGTPVVAYAAGALPEVVGGCGVLVPEGDRRALLAALTDLMSREGATRARDLVDCGRRRAARHFAPETMVASALDAYSRATDL